MITWQMQFTIRQFLSAEKCVLTWAKGWWRIKTWYVVTVPILVTDDRYSLCWWQVQDICDWLYDEVINNTLVTVPCRSFCSREHFYRLIEILFSSNMILKNSVIWFKQNRIWRKKLMKKATIIIHGMLKLLINFLCRGDIVHNYHFGKHIHPYEQFDWRILRFWKRKLGGWCGSGMLEQHWLYQTINPFWSCPARTEPQFDRASLI